MLCSSLVVWYARQATQYLSQSNGGGCKLCWKVIGISGKNIVVDLLFIKFGKISIMETFEIIFALNLYRFDSGNDCTHRCIIGFY